jgi:hypothetical protein
LNHAVGLRELYCFFYYAKAVCIAGSVERWQQISLNLASGGLLKNACLRESHHRIAIADGNCPIARDRPLCQSILEGGGNPKMEPEQQHGSEQAEACDGSEKSGPDLAKKRNKAKLRNASDQNNTTDRTWRRADVMALGL